MDSKTRYTKNLFIPKGTMVAGESYYFQVEASVAGHPELWNEANAIVEMQYSRLDINLEYKKEIDVFEDFVINATGSFDPDDPRPEDPQPPVWPIHVQVGMCTMGPQPPQLPGNRFLLSGEGHLLQQIRECPSSL